VRGLARLSSGVQAGLRHPQRYRRSCGGQR
jgi:hypothetical protein